MIKHLPLFSGIGAFDKAFKNLGIDSEIVAYCEIDKYASKAFSLIHNIPESLNLGDITKVDTDKLPDFDLLTWGFPCQDISVAGKMRGIIEGETRSGLYYEGYRILKSKKPKYSIIENVKSLTSKKFKADFEKILSDIEDLGYTNYWKVLNAKDYGIPQNRERVFIVSIRKDVDKGKFEFPAPYDNGLRLKDLLEAEVDEKYYISQEKTDKLLMQLKDKEFSNAIRTGGRGSVDRHQWDMVAVQINLGELKEKEDDICSCLDANYYKGLDNHAARTGVYVPLEPRQDGISNTLTTVLKDNLILTSYRIRKLTPKECFRLMGFGDSDYCILKDNNISDSQIYKMAGNSIVVKVLEGILEQLFKKEIANKTKQLVQAMTVEQLVELRKLMVAI